ncbi:MAG: hypothetical protein WDO13_15655 [Verrucomicrobiota bacterium]
MIVAHHDGMLPELTRAVPGRDLTGDEVAAAAAQLLDPTIGDAAKADFLRGVGSAR